MVARRAFLAVSVASLVLFAAQPAMANGMSPVAAFWPGFYLMSPLLGIPATLLAAPAEQVQEAEEGVEVAAGV